MSKLIMMTTLHRIIRNTLENDMEYYYEGKQSLQLSQGEDRPPDKSKKLKQRKKKSTKTID